MRDRILTTFLTAACLFLAVVLILPSGKSDAAPVTGAAAPSTNPSPPGPTDQLDAALLRPVGDLQLDDITLEQALNLLAERAHANMVVHWKRLNGARATKVHLDLKGMDLGRALGAVLGSLEQGEDAGFTVRDGIVIVSTRDDMQLLPITLIYNVRDIIERADETTTRQEAIEKLAKIVQDVVDPGSWRNTGGQTGAIRDLMGLLIISQTADNHARIAELLQHLRDADKNRPYTKNEKQPALKTDAPSTTQ